MKFKIKNFLGCKTAELSPAPFCAVFGNNGAGKSSIARAIASTLLSDPLAGTGVKKNEALKLVNDSAREASAELIADNSAVTVSWPNCTVKNTGEVLSVSELSAGIKAFSDIPKKDVPKFFNEVLSPNPREKDLAQALEHLLSAREIKELWQDIRLNSWDAMSKSFAEKATLKKGEWKNVTGINWGTQKASNYMPEHWSSELDHASRVELETALSDAQETLEAVVASSAVTDVEIERLQNVVKNWSEKKSALAEVTAKIEEAHAVKNKYLLRKISFSSVEEIEEIEKLKLQKNEIEKALQAVLQKLKEGQNKFDNLQRERSKAASLLREREQLVCPACSASLELAGGKLKLAQKKEETDKQKIEEEIKELNKKIKTAETWLEKKRSEASEFKKIQQRINAYNSLDSIEKEKELFLNYENSLKEMEILSEQKGALLQLQSEAQKAKEELEKFLKISSKKHVDVDINAAREALRIAQDNLAAWATKQQADNIHKLILHYKEVSEVLSSKGLRKKLLVEKLKEVNTEILSWSPWPVQINDDLSVRYNDRLICCESEQWRIDVVVQVLNALLLDDRIIVVDRGDRLDNNNKNKLLKMLKKTGLKAILFFKANNKKDIIDLSNVALGESLWINNGKAERI